MFADGRVSFVINMKIVFLAFLFSSVSGQSNSAENDQRLENLRSLMSERQIQAYIVPSSDDHHTEQVPTPDKRREFISGFSGSVGNVLITMTEALLWVDSRYHLQALRQLSSSWKLMPVENSSAIDEWVTKNLENCSYVGVDPKKILAKTFISWSKNLNSTGITLLPIEENLIDEIWADRPSYKEGNVFVHGLEFAGEPYQSKLKRVREAMSAQSVDLMAVSKLDEIAWLLNLRGVDGEFTPTFVSYVIVKNDSAAVYTDLSKVTDDVIKHLKEPGAEVDVLPYEQFYDDWETFVNESAKVLVPDNANYLIFSKVPKDKILHVTSPIRDMKAAKNDVEVSAARHAHVKDAVAICKLYYQMEKEIPDGVAWDEMKVSEVLDFYRSQQEYNKGIGFPNIIAFGKNSALPHYHSTPETNLSIDTSAPVTLDTGGQYLDGTIDTTRVWHFGTPTPFQIQVYTALLQGVADLGGTVFPRGASYSVMDFIMRRPLLKLGLTFGHGTTHGTGLFLEVHEDFNSTYFVNFIGSQEPGYYRRDDFGMRLENLVTVIPAPVQNAENREPLLAFSPLTLVPYEPKLIDRSKMDKSQVDWVNDYHETVRKVVGDEMIKQKLHILYKWLMEKTNPL